MEAAVVRYLAIKNFQHFQHYKDRRPPWVKLYRDLWRDRDFFRLSERSKLLFIGLTTIASITDNEIPEDAEWISVELGLPAKSIDLNPLIDAGFLTVLQTASNPLAEREQDATRSSLLCLSSSLSSSDSGSRKKKRKGVSPVQYTEEFEKRFWAIYPRKDGKADAFELWLALSPDDRERAAADVPSRLANNWATRPVDKMPYGSTYLSKRIFDDPIQGRAETYEENLRREYGAG